jgi:acylphosphatase
MDRRAVRLTIRGRVQGVGYRAWALETARRLRLDGWARNRRDGTVEMLAIGPEEAIARLVVACRRGPPGAIVNEVGQAAAVDDGGVGFDIRPTA